MFRRSSTQYGQTPIPETPYLRAGQLWDERMGSARAQGNVPADLFVFDDQLHMIRETMSGPLALRALAQAASRCP